MHSNGTERAQPHPSEPLTRLEHPRHNVAHGSGIAGGEYTALAPAGSGGSDGGGGRGRCGVIRRSRGVGLHDCLHSEVHTSRANVPLHAARKAIKPGAAQREAVAGDGWTGGETAAGSGRARAPHCRARAAPRPHIPITRTHPSCARRLSGSSAGVAPNSFTLIVESCSSLVLWGPAAACC